MGPFDPSDFPRNLEANPGNPSDFPRNLESNLENPSDFPRNLIANPGNPSDFPRNLIANPSNPGAFPRESRAIPSNTLSDPKNPVLDSANLNPRMDPSGLTNRRHDQARLTNPIQSANPFQLSTDPESYVDNLHSRSGKTFDNVIL